MIEQVQMFKTSDGAIFNTLADAERYEDGMELYDLIITRIGGRYVDDWQTWVIEESDIQTFIESNWEELKRIMENK